MKLQRFRLNTESYGELLILRPIPSESRQGSTLIIDPWGDLAPVRDKAPDLAQIIPIVTGEEWSHAMHGHASPLMQKLGPPPQALLKMTPIKKCSLQKSCIMHHATRCLPNKILPECWWPDLEEEVRRPVSIITLAWAEGRYVVIVEGAEFSLQAGRR